METDPIESDGSADKTSVDAVLELFSGKGSVVAELALAVLKIVGGPL